MAGRIVAMLMIPATVGCSGLVATPSGPDESAAAQDSGTGATGTAATTGRVEAHLSLPPAEAFAEVHFTLMNGVTVVSGVARVDDPTAVDISIDNVAAGTGYTLQVDTMSTDHPTMCTGTSQPFQVTAGQTTQISVSPACTGPSTQDPMTYCPVWNTLVANPQVVPFAGGSSMLEAVASSPDPVSTFAWSAPAGTIHDVKQTATSSTAVFTCPVASGGTVNIELVVSNPIHPDAGFCPPYLGTGTVAVVCPEPDAGADAVAVVDAGVDD
jgi:hypothetical protein